MTSCQLNKNLVHYIFKMEGMALIKSVRGYTPKFGKNCFLAENATVIGEVVMGENCTVWFNAVVRGDVHSISIGDNTNIQDGAMIHCTYQKAIRSLEAMYPLHTTPWYMDVN